MKRLSASGLEAIFLSAGLGSRLAKRGGLFAQVPCPPRRDHADAPERPDGDCLIWRGQAHPNGYGLITEKVEGVNFDRKVHRVAFRLMVGREPVDMLGHRCEVRPCANPFHVREVTNHQNVREGRNARWPIALLAMAPEQPCPACGGGTTTSINTVQGQYRYWLHTCNSCLSSHKEGKPLLVAGRPFCGKKHGQRIPDQVVAPFLEGVA